MRIPKTYIKTYIHLTVTVITISKTNMTYYVLLIRWFISNFKTIFQYSNDCRVTCPLQRHGTILETQRGMQRDSYLVKLLFYHDITRQMRNIYKLVYCITNPWRAISNCISIFHLVRLTRRKQCSKRESSCEVLVDILVIRLPLHILLVY